MESLNKLWASPAHFGATSWTRHNHFIIVFLSFDFLCDFISVKSSKIQSFVFDFGCFFDFLKKLIFTSDLEIYDVIEIFRLETVDSCIKAFFIPFSKNLSVTIWFRSWIMIFKNSYIKSLIQSIPLFI
jgi:hypothetical protein